MSHICLLTACCCLTLTSHVLGQTAASPTVEFRRHEDGPLRSADFAATIPADRGGRQASTYTRIRYTFQYQGTVSNKKAQLMATDVDAFAVVLPGKSWNAAPRDAALMDHEQGHFDITHLHALHWRRQVEGLIAKSAIVGEGTTKEDAYESLQARLQKELTAIDGALEAEQVRYDRETNHGLDRVKQAQWRMRLNRDLAALKPPAR